MTIYWVLIMKNFNRSWVTKLGLKDSLMAVPLPRSSVPLSYSYWTLIFWSPGNKAKDRNFSYFSNFTVPPQNTWENAASIFWKIRRAVRFHSHLPADIWALLSARSSLLEAASVWLVSNSIFRKNNCELWQEFSLTLSLKLSSPPAHSREQLSIPGEAPNTWAISATCKASELRSQLKGHRASLSPSKEPFILTPGCLGLFLGSKQIHKAGKQDPAGATGLFEGNFLDT